jgi:hypothetical protein
MTTLTPSPSSLTPSSLIPISSQTQFDIDLKARQAEYRVLLDPKKRSTPSMTMPKSTSPSLPVIDCSKTDKPRDCPWYSISSSDRSNPIKDMICPADKPDMCWMDYSSTTKREFKCGACNISTNSQTDSCHITMTASANKNTSGWESNMTTSYIRKCRNKWFKM